MRIIIHTVILSIVESVRKDIAKSAVRTQRNVIIVDLNVVIIVIVWASLKVSG
jgi:hypothetical protein